MFSTAGLLTERITLRLLEERDAPALFALYSDQEVMRYWSHAPWTTIDQARIAIAEAQADCASGASLHCAIEQRTTGALVGSCALYAFASRDRRATVGYLLSKPYWGQGYMSEAIRMLIDYAFLELDLNRVEADVNLSNAGSSRALERLGFRREACLRERWIVAGHKVDTQLYGLLREDWRATSMVCPPRYPKHSPRHGLRAAGNAE